MADTLDLPIKVHLDENDVPALNDAFTRLADAQIRAASTSQALRSRLNELAQGGLLPTADNLEEISKLTYDNANATQALRSAQEEAYPRLKHNVTETWQATSLLSREFGFNLPRAMESAIAHSNILGPLIQSAFSGIVLVGFLNILEQVPDSIGRIIDKFTEWDTQARKTYDDIVQKNTQLLLSNTQLADKIEAVNLIGLSGSQKYRQEIENAGSSVERWAALHKNLSDRQQEIQKNIENIKNRTVEWAALQPGINAFAGSIANWIDRSNEDVKTLQKELTDTTNLLDQVTAHIQNMQKVQAPTLAAEQTNAQIKEAQKAAEEMDRLAEQQRRQAERDADASREQRRRELLAELTDTNEYVKANVAALASMNQEIERDRQKRVQEEIQAIQRESKARDDEFKRNVQRAKEAAAPWLEFERTIDRALDQVVVGILRGTQTIGQAFQRLAGDIIISMLEAFAKVLIAQAAYSLSSGAIGKEHAFGDIMRSAYQAAAKVYAEVPFPFNLAVAPVVFATVAAMGGSLSSAAGGMWQVPSDMLAMVHKDESILPAGIAGGLRNMVEGGGGPDVHFHINALDGPSVQAFFEKNSDKIVATFRKAQREFRV